MSEKQQTLKSEVSLKGKGLHTGENVTITIKPAVADTGYKFIRTDLEGSPSFLAVTENVIDTSRGTVIGKGNATVSTIEHLLASLYALGVDNVEIEVNGPELPIFDGSAKEYVRAIKNAGIEEQEAERYYYYINNKTVFTDSTGKVTYIAYPEDGFSVTTHIQYPSSILQNQFAQISSLDEFENEISLCRTFVFFRELEYLSSKNLIKGGDIDNAIIIVDKDVTEDEIQRLSVIFGPKDIKVEKGILNNLKLHFDNEPARHKLMDFIGDLALCGARVKGHFEICCPGHKANVEYTSSIRKIVKKEKGKPVAPKIDLNATPVRDIEAIKKLLPHRFPFLLVDKVMELTSTCVIGIKNVTFNELQFLGHFPVESVMPGVLILEAMAQCGGVLALETVPDPENYITYFLSMDKIRFRRIVKPGDTIIFKLILLEPIRRGIVHMQGYAFVGDILATEAEMMAQIVKKE
ncbi:MAG: bifunctional UDP-3-O-[3-hydroxymyristoyl] N-acetylglucosamine deacetylase/3-hydroxyacyl-ACP dehydratase [Bacteroidales bacterium]